MTPFPSSIRKLDLRLTGRLKKKDSLLAGDWERRGVRSPKSYDRKTALSSIIHLILSGTELSRCNYCKFCSSYRFEKNISWGNLSSFCNMGAYIGRKTFTTSVHYDQCCGSVAFWYGSGSGSCSSRPWPSRCQNIIFPQLFCLLLFEGTSFMSVQRYKIKKKSQNSRNQGFSYNGRIRICSNNDGTGSGRS